MHGLFVRQGLKRQRYSAATDKAGAGRSVTTDDLLPGKRERNKVGATLHGVVFAILCPGVPEEDKLDKIQ
jgi:hypothetical protein